MSATLDMTMAEQRFNSAFDSLLSQSKKSTDELWNQQVSGIVRNLFSVTPPMGGSEASVKLPAPGKKSRGITINFGEGKARGKSTIESDIAFAFKKSKKSDENALNQYLARRTKQKRFRRFGEKINATAQDIVAVKKNILARQGTTASGWNSAVSKMGISVPKWITGHNNVPSKFSINNGRTGFYDFQSVNGTNHTDSARIERRIAIAINMQANSIERWLKVYNERLGNDILK